MKKSIRFISALLFVVVMLASFSAVSVTAADVLLVPTVVTYNIPMIMTCDEFTYSVGDVNSDGLVSVKDATLIQKYQVGFVTLSEESLLAGDINLDEKVDVRDASLIMDYVSENR